jgi:hypothetical protein
MALSSRSGCNTQLPHWCNQLTINMQANSIWNGGWTACTKAKSGLHRLQECAPLPCPPMVYGHTPPQYHNGLPAQLARELAQSVGTCACTAMEQQGKDSNCNEGHKTWRTLCNTSASADSATASAGSNQ